MATNDYSGSPSPSTAALDSLATSLARFLRARAQRHLRVLPSALAGRRHAEEWQDMILRWTQTTEAQREHAPGVLAGLHTAVRDMTPEEVGELAIGLIEQHGEQQVPGPRPQPRVKASAKSLKRKGA